MSKASRRRFLAALSATALLGQTRKPVGLQMVAVAKDLQTDLDGTLKKVADMGYQVVEFSARPYFGWTTAEAKRVRGLLDGLNLRCHSTHNEIASFSGDGLSKAMELNQILGSNTLVSVRGPSQPTPDNWKRYSEQLSEAAQKMRPANMLLGFHNHDIEFKTMDGTRAIDLLATNKDITAFHLNVGLCLKGGGDPVAFIDQVPGRIQTLLCQDFEGKARWKPLFASAERTGRLQFYLIQRTDGLSLVQRDGVDPIDAVGKDLRYFKQIHG